MRILHCIHTYIISCILYLLCFRMYLGTNVKDKWDSCIACIFIDYALCQKTKNQKNSSIVNS